MRCSSEREMPSALATRTRRSSPPAALEILLALAILLQAPRVLAAPDLWPLQAPIRGITIGPIENARHPGAGYGSRAYEQAIYEIHQMGGTWISLTPFGRTLDLHATGVDLRFEAPPEENRAAVVRAIQLAHAQGLRVFLVPHLWVESGGWRALLDPGDELAWQLYAESYRRFLLFWAQAAEEAHADLLATGVEQRSWVTGPHAPLYEALIQETRQVYHGLITYSANWDDVEDTVILGDLDLIGINAFYPLAARDGASFDELLEGGAQVAARVRALSDRWHKPVLFTEIGYTTRPNPAVKPWLWPDDMKGVSVDEVAQAYAYAALLAPMLNEPSFAGFFVWRLYSDPDDTSQESELGFSPRGKLAELVLRDAFTCHWASDPYDPGGLLARERSDPPGLYPGLFLAPALR